MKKKEKEKNETKDSYKEYEDVLLEYLTSPSEVIRHPKDIQIEKFHRVIAAINYPRVVDPGWLTRLIEMNVDFDLSIHINPYTIESTVSLLESELKKQKTDIYSMESEGKIVPQSLIQQHQDTTALLEMIQQGTEKLFDMSLYLDAKAFDKEELEKISKKIMATMNSIMIIPKVPSFQMYEGLKSVLPIADNKLNINRNITSSAAAACFPFAISSLEQHSTGILIGFNQTNNIPIIIDPFELTNPNILVLGTSGGGKSYTLKLFLMREFMEGIQINVIDPQAEYTDLVNTFEGKVIRIAPDSDTVINPFDLLDQSYDEKKLSLFAFFRVLLGELTEGQRAILDDAIDSVYAEKGITKDTRTWSRKPPVLEDLYNEVLPLTRSEKEIIFKPAMSIVNRLKTYVTGPLRFLNQQTQMDLGNRFISFDIKDIPDIGKGPIMFLILEYVYTQMKKSKERKILLIDEAWTVLSAGDQAEYITRIVKTCRKFNLSLCMITQDVEDVLASQAGRAVMHNTAMKILLKQDPTVIDKIQEGFKINDAEVRFLKIATAGRALLIAGNTRVPIYIQASPEEHKIITTKADELVAREKGLVGEGPTAPIAKEVGTDFDINKSLHRKSDLTDTQIKQLSERGFDEVRVINLDGKPEIFMIMNETKEPEEHFVLQELILEIAKKYTDRALTHHTKLPDITFETADGRIIAIELEADIGMNRNLEDMREKINLLKKYNDYFFVAANPKLREYQEEFGEILTRTQVAAKIAAYFEG